MSAPLPGWPHAQSPFHAGELALQARAGVTAKIDQQARRGVRDFFPDQHREFYGLLPFLVIGAVDAHGQPRASVLTGRPGFITTPDERTLRVDAKPPAGDRLQLRLGQAIGGVGVQLSTRRRNRWRGVVAALDEAGFAVTLSQGFGNCPQYIQVREFEATDELGRPPVAKPLVEGERLDARARAIIAKADTFFIATGAESDAARVADASHRGGKPGFVRIDDDATLTTPDFVGNFFFNTLGNLLLDPRAGLLFLDFDTGDTLYLVGRAETIWDGEEVKAFAGAERLLRFHITGMVRVEGSLPLRFSPPEFSPILSRTGSWEDAAKTLEAARTRNLYRPFRIARIEDESAVIRSLYLEPADGGGVAAHEPGQYLPIRLAIPGEAEPVTRTYTISDAPNNRGYRLSVKKEGLASGRLHGLTAGEVIEAIAPRGDFVFEPSERPVAMISAGVGITPMIAMLNSLLVNEGRTRHHNRIHFIHGARNGAVLAFREHLRAKAKRHANLALHIRLSHPGSDDRVGETHDSEGQIDKALLQQVLPLDDYDVYLCGPPPFMQALYDTLRGLGVPDARIRFEAFGPASVKRRRDAAPAPAVDAEEAVQVVFAKSGKTARWRPAAGSLLELAEANGVDAAYSCRSGVCGTCSVRVLKGAVDYAEAPMAAPGAGEALICCATPHPGPHLDGHDDREGVTLDL